MAATLQTHDDDAPRAEGGVQFWGDRVGAIVDPFGHSWLIATRVEDVPPEELGERAKAAMAAPSG